MKSQQYKREFNLQDGISRNAFQTFLLIYSVLGLVAGVNTFSFPSEPETAWIGSYSLLRVILGLLTLLASGVGWTFFILFRQGKLDPFFNKLNNCLKKGDRPFFAVYGAWGIFFLMAWCFLFSWLFIPKNFRSQIAWIGFTALSAALILKVSFRNTFAGSHFLKKYHLLPRFSDLFQKQKKVFFLLIGLGLVYILILLPSNLNGTKDWADFQHYGGDEYVIYPILMNVMKPGKDFSAELYHIFIYEDYHYGFPFYAWSAVILLPVKWIAGKNFPNLVQINLPLLRIFVSVIPLILSALLITGLFTRFKSWLCSPAVFLFLLLAPGSLQNNQGFWHPDGLNLLFVCLTLFFLDRDHYRFGINFWAAAFFTGLSIATRLFGFFFALAILVYLISGVIQKQLTFHSAAKRGLIFILIMCITVLFADPFLFRSDARNRMVQIMTEKKTEMDTGYGGQNDPRHDYRTGWDAWYPAFEDHYTMMFCFFFLIFSLIFACFYGPLQLLHRMELCWFLMAGGYLIFFFFF